MFIKRLITKWRYKKIKRFLTLAIIIENSTIEFCKKKKNDADSPDFIHENAAIQHEYSEATIDAFESVLRFIEREEVR